MNHVDVSVDDEQYHNLMNHFPHKFLTTHRVSHLF